MRTMCKILLSDMRAVSDLEAYIEVLQTQQGSPPRLGRHTSTKH